MGIVITDDLILSSLKGEISAAESAELLLWRGASDENERRYQHIAKLWELRHLVEPALHVAAPPAAADILRRGLPRRVRKERRREGRWSALRFMC